MWREVGQSLTGVLVGLVVVLVPPELPVRRQLARRSHNSPPKQEHPAQRSLKPVKTGRNLVIGAKKGNARCLTSGLVKGLMRGPVKGLVIDRERVIERKSTTETGTEVETETGTEKERADVTEETETVVVGIMIGSGVGKGNGTTRAESTKKRVSMREVGRSRGEESQRKGMGTTKGVVDVQAIMSVRRNREEVSKTATMTVMGEWRKKNTVMMIVSTTSGQSVPSRVIIKLDGRRYFLA